MHYQTLASNYVTDDSILSFFNSCVEE